eukprot:g18819.t1
MLAGAENKFAEFGSFTGGGVSTLETGRRASWQFLAYGQCGPALASGRREWLEFPEDDPLPTLRGESAVQWRVVGAVAVVVEGSVSPGQADQ